MAVQKDNGISIPKIQQGFGSLEATEKRGNGYKKRGEATTKGIQKIGERKLKLEKEKELERFLSEFLSFESIFCPSRTSFLLI